MFEARSACCFRAVTTSPNDKGVASFAVKHRKATEYWHKSCSTATNLALTSPKHYCSALKASRASSSSRGYVVKVVAAGQQRQSFERKAVVLTRSDIVNKQVITRTGGSQLGVVTQLWVDSTRWEVVSLDLRQNLLFGDLEFLLLESLRQVGDVILVHDEDALEPDLSVYGLYTLIGSEVITESGEPLGRVRDFTFEPDSGRVARIHFDALGVPLIPDSVVSSYSLSVEEVVTVGPDRVVVLEGAEARVKQLTASFLQRLAVTVPPWEDSLNYGYLDENYGDYDDWGVQRRPARSQRQYDEYDRSGSFLPPAGAREPPRPEYEYARSGRGGPRTQRSEYDMPPQQRPRRREASQQPSPEPSTASQKKASPLITLSQPRAPSCFVAGIS
ncbi:hypothetical protein CYMTET_55387 [Cymbomonas tetramitiformis]|uniref:PRC-barrel domain-containing protein n=1 Tax=Cymbomonas tetramitiformis TaxID=36881 RepID=A0AAE0EMV2_9CHLO|nr:hypothetical protein CYMTET_55387 [Cymbomonas tetramitiformis]